MLTVNGVHIFASAVSFLSVRHPLAPSVHTPLIYTMVNTFYDGHTAEVHTVYDDYYSA